MWSFRRFFYRIFLPLVFVAAVAAVLRWNMIRDFNEQNVRREPVESELRDGGQPDYAESFARKVEFSEENRAHVVAALELARQRMEDSFRSQADDEEAASTDDAVQAAKEELERSVDALEAAEEENWKERRDAAYDALQAYADATRAFLAED